MAKAAKQVTEYVQYVGGRATVREITRAQWARIDIDQDSAVWNRLNRHLIRKDFFCDEALDYLLNRDGDFRLVRSDELK
jgi:hypothetical protein